MAAYWDLVRVPFRVNLLGTSKRSFARPSGPSGESSRPALEDHLGCFQGRHEIWWDDLGLNCVQAEGVDVEKNSSEAGAPEECVSER